MNIADANAEALLHSIPDPQRYAGMSPLAASVLASALVEAAARTGCWESLPEHLCLLRACSPPPEPKRVGFVCAIERHKEPQKREWWISLWCLHHGWDEAESARRFYEMVATCTLLEVRL